MSYEGSGPKLDYYPCRYGRSRMVFRGPRVSTDGPYTVVIGGSEVYGRYVEDPFTDQLAERTGRRVLNLGVMNAGVDAFIRDEALMEVIGRAECVVVQVMGAGNMSNRHYAVHPRRNDRFLRHSTQMAKLFPGIDFSEFAFMRHMLHALRQRAPGPFAQLEAELRAAWIARMRLLLGRLPGQKVLLLIENHNAGPLGPEPLFVSFEMLQTLEGHIDKLVHCDISEHMNERGIEAMQVPETEIGQARLMLPPAAHEAIAMALARSVRRRNGMAA
jgi:hypothetical protein